MASDLLDDPDFIARIQKDLEREGSKTLSNEERTQAFKSLLGGE